MKFYSTVLLAIVLSSILFSCTIPERAICSYAARNKEVQRTPQKVDTVWVTAFFHEYTSNERSYFEAAKFNYNGEKKIIIASDLFVDPVRFNFFTGFTRGFSPYDKYEKVNHLVLENSQVNELITFYEKLHQPADTKASNAIFDYTINKDVFFTFNVSYVSSATGDRLKINDIKWMNIWMNGRKHVVDAKKFFKALKKEI